MICKRAPQAGRRANPIRSCGGRFPVGVRTFDALDRARNRRFPAAAQHAGQDLAPASWDVFPVASRHARRSQCAVRTAAAPGAFVLGPRTRPNPCPLSAGRRGPGLAGRLLGHALRGPGDQRPLRRLRSSRARQSPAAPDRPEQPATDSRRRPTRPGSAPPGARSGTPRAKQSGSRRTDPRLARRGGLRPARAGRGYGPGGQTPVLTRPLTQDHWSGTASGGA
jgi:hypothetical protein